METYSSLEKRLGLGFEEIEPILELMTQANLVRQVKTGGWVQILDPDKVMVSDIYRLFTFRPEVARAAAAGDAKLERVLDGIIAALNEKMDVPLSQLFADAIPHRSIVPSTEPVQ